MFNHGLTVVNGGPGGANLGGNSGTGAVTEMTGGHLAEGQSLAGSGEELFLVVIPQPLLKYFKPDHFDTGITDIEDLELIITNDDAVF